MHVRATKESGTHHLVGVSPYVVSACKQESLSIDFYVSVDLHLGFEIADPPDLTGRIDPLDRVSVDRNRAVRGHDNVRYRDNSDSAFEFHQSILMPAIVVTI